MEFHKLFTMDLWFITIKHFFSSETILTRNIIIRLNVKNMLLP